VCLAIVYDKLGRHADAEATLGKMKVAFGEVGAPVSQDLCAMGEYVCDSGLARDGLSAARRRLDLPQDLDPLRNMPRFKAIGRVLKFPPQ
jgi:hypothetical protein